MKTLEEIENEVRALTSAFIIMERTRGTDEGVYDIKAAQDRQDKLFASLAQWDAVVREVMPALQAEMGALKSLRDGETEYQRVKAAGTVKHEITLVEWGPRNGYGEVTDAALNPTGLARLEHLRELLGEGEEE